MKNRFIAILLALALMTASGCASPFEAEYSYSADYSDTVDSDLSASGTEIRTYTALRSAIIGLINEGETEGEFRFSNYNGSVAEDLAEVCLDIRSSTALGAYAVEELTYALNRIVSYYSATIYITYSRTPAEIAGVVQVSGVTELEDTVAAAMNAFSQKLVVSLYSLTVDEDYISRLVHSCYISDPLTTVLEPQVSVTGYPESGASRIYELELSYGAAGGALSAMRSALTAAVNEAVSGLTVEGDVYLALECARRLVSGCEFGAEGADSDPYAAILGGSADSQGAALAMKLLCDAVGVECIVVEGYSSAQTGSAHWWNIVTIDDVSYHIDVERMALDGEGEGFLLSDSDIWGEYIWDTDSYPECSGTLSYYDLAEPDIEPPPPHTEQPEETDEPAVSEPPAQTEAPTPTPEPTETPTPTETPEPTLTQSVEENE